MKYVLNFAVLLVTFAMLGCDSYNGTGSDPESEIAEIRMVPDSVLMEVGDQVDFSLVALTESGDTVQNANLDVTWFSRDPAVFTVEAGGLATAQDTGTAYCVAEATDELAKASLSARFTGRDSAFVQVFLF